MKHIIVWLWGPGGCANRILIHINREGSTQRRYMSIRSEPFRFYELDSD